MTNQILKIAVIQSGRRGYEIERSAGFWPGKLSKIYAGIIEPTSEERIAIANVLGKPVAELFPTNEPVEAA